MRWFLFRLVTETTIPIATIRFLTYLARLERGYDAVGGEVLVGAIVAYIVYRAIDTLWDAVEEYAYEQRRNQKRRSRRNAWNADRR